MTIEEENFISNKIWNFEWDEKKKIFRNEIRKKNVFLDKEFKENSRRWIDERRMSFEMKNSRRWISSTEWYEKISFY
jgi:hypothetical protein